MGEKAILRVGEEIKKKKSEIGANGERERERERECVCSLMKHTQALAMLSNGTGGNLRKGGEE